MTPLTLTPEAAAYATAVIALLSLSCSALAGHLHRLLGAGPGSFLPLYATLMGTVAAAALLAWDVPMITQQDWTSTALAPPVGLTAAGVAIAGEAFVRRHAAPSRGMAIPRRRILVGRDAAASLLWPNRSPGDGRRALPLMLALVAALEEILFRGIVVDLARALPWTPVAVAALLASLAAFAASHVALGWTEMLSKLPLGAAALGAALLLGSVFPAIVAHVLFNLHAWAVAGPTVHRNERPLARSTVGPQLWA